MRALSKNIVYLLLAFYSSIAISKTGPSFNCTKAESKIDISICNDETLSFLDYVMADIYHYVKSHTKKKEELVNNQKEWIKYRNYYFYKEDVGDEEGLECSNTSYLPTCYSERIGKLIGFLDSKDELNEYLYKKYRKILGYGDIPKEKVAAFLYENQYRNAFNQITWAYPCTGYTETVLKYSPPILITEIHGSNTCGGSSAAFRTIVGYCEETSTFVEKMRLDVPVYSENIDYEESIGALQKIGCE